MVQCLSKKKLRFSKCFIAKNAMIFSQSLLLAPDGYLKPIDSLAIQVGLGQTGGKKMTCLESMQLPAQKLHNSFLSILVPIILKSDKNCGCAGIFHDMGVRFLRFTRKSKQFSLFCSISWLFYWFRWFQCLYLCFLGQGLQ